MHEAAGNFEASAHSSGKASHQFVGEFGQAHGFEQARNHHLTLGGR